MLAGGDASAAFDHGGLLDSLKKALTERALNAEMDHCESASNTKPLQIDDKLLAALRNAPFRWGPEQRLFYSYAHTKNFLDQLLG